MALLAFCSVVIFQRLIRLDHLPPPLIRSPGERGFCKAGSVGGLFISAGGEVTDEPNTAQQNAAPDKCLVENVDR
jgi:hypothetical protein